MKIIQTILIAVLALALISCSHSTNESAQREESGVDDFEIGTVDIDNEKLKAEIFDVIDQFPPPSLVPLMLEAPGQYYDPLPNTPRRADDYMVNSHTAALNLGVYTADVGYLVSYNKMYAIGEYLEVLNKISDNLEITTAFDIEVMRQVEENMDDRVAILNMIDNEYRGINKFLRSDYRTREAVMVVTGAFIEGLYISSYYLKNHPEIENLQKLISEQKDSLKEIIEMLETLDIAVMADLTTEIKQLQTKFDDIEALTNQTALVRKMIVEV